MFSADSHHGQGHRTALCCARALDCPARGWGAPPGICVAVARKSRAFGMDMRTRVGSGDPLSQPWVSGSGGCGGLGAVRWLHRHLRFTQHSSSLHPAWAWRGPCTWFTSVGGSRMWCLWAQTVRIKTPLATDSVTLDHFYTSLYLSFLMDPGRVAGPQKCQAVEQLVGNIAIVVQSLKSYIQLFAARKASLSFIISQSLLRLMSIQVVMASNYLILCCPLSSCPQSLPASGSLPMSWLFTSGGQSVRALASASVHYWQVNMAQIGQFFLFTVEAPQLWNIIKLGFKNGNFFCLEKETVWILIFFFLTFEII